MSQSTRPATQTGEPEHGWAFGGPWGNLAMMVLLPALSLYLWLAIHRHGGALVIPTPAVLAELPLPTPRAFAYVGGWLAFQILLQIVLPGRTVKGLRGRDGVTLEYKLNGFLSLWVSLAAVALLVRTGAVTCVRILDELGPMLVVAVIASFALSAWLYGWGFRSDREEHRTGNRVYDFFMGTALNPRVHLSPRAQAVTPEGAVVDAEAPTGPRVDGFDVKLFFESKIGMTTWLVLALAMAGAQWEREGSVSLSMLLVCGFQLLYVADFYFFEDAMLSTWDINNENLGFMLMFGFVVWMPFNFSLQAQYLVYHRPDLPLPAAAGIVALDLLGYWIFRTANLQKHRFRTESDPKIWGAPATFIQTKRGTRLLTSGWWGLSRHANYLGDLLMALAWCLPCGLSHVPPYFYFLYFAPLLLDRERRDHRACAKKYGDDWDAYCKKVSYRIVPWVY